MNENEEKEFLTKKLKLQNALRTINEEINWQEERTKKESKNQENYIATLEKELEEIKREIPNFSEDVYKQYIKYFEAEEKIIKIMHKKYDSLEAIKERLILLTYQKENITTELEKIDNELTHLTKEEISK